MQAREFSEEFIRQVCSDVLRSKFESIFTVVSLFEVLKKFLDNYRNAFLKACSILQIYSLFSYTCGAIFPYHRLHTLPSCFLKVLYYLKRGNWFCVSGWGQCFYCYNTLSKFLFEFSQPSCLPFSRVEDYKTVTIVSPKVLPQDFQDHQVQEALKAQEGFLVYQGMMAFQGWWACQVALGLVGQEVQCACVTVLKVFMPWFSASGAEWD